MQFAWSRKEAHFWLSLTGRPGTKGFIKADAPAWINARR